MEPDSVFTFILDNVKNFFYPEGWMALDLKLAKSELMALLTLDRYGELTMSQFSDHMGMPMNTATGLVNRLVDGGYVVRERSESDRRLVLIKATEAGREITGEFKNLVREYVQLIDRALTPEEKEILWGVALKIIDVLRTKRVSQEREEEVPEIKKIEIE